MKRNEKEVGYERPDLEVVDIQLEGPIMSDSLGEGEAGGGTSGDSGWD